MEEDSIDSVHLCASIIRRQEKRCIGAAILRRREIDNTDHDIKSSVSYSIELVDFFDNEQYSGFDSLLLQIGSCKLYISEEYQEVKTGDAKKLRNIIQRNDIVVSYIKKSFFARKVDTCLKLEKLCGKQSHSIAVAEKDRQHSLDAVEGLLLSLGIDRDDDQYGKYEIKLGSLSKYLRLDSSAAEAINLLPRSDHPSPSGSIYGILNRCKTKMGSRLLERWLRQPLIDHDEINKRLDIVDIFKHYVSYRNQLCDEVLKSIPDLDSVVSRMQKKNAGLPEVYRLYVFCRSLPRIVNILTSIQQESSETILANTLKEKLTTQFQTLQEKFLLYEQLIEHVIDLDKLPELFVNSKHDPELDELKEELEDIESKTQQLLKQARDDTSLDVKLEESVVHRGLIFRSTKTDDERLIRSSISSAKVLSIQKNGVHFTTNQLERLSDRRRDLQSTYKEKQAVLSSKAVETALSYLPLAEIASGVVAELDVLLSFATVAATSSNPYTRPTMLPIGSGMIDLKGARHPCVEMMNDVNFIPNDYRLVNEESTYQIITGPNMGGKSTYIRGLGSILVMAQVGSYIPCDSATVTIIDAILARVGAGDAVQKGVSTFMAEMLEASIILQTATSNSLLIVDELGRGTSTFDGFGLAWAISEYIITKIHCFTLFATHFHELTALEKNHQCVQNKHVSAIMENKQLVMMYTIQMGPCLQSFGINVAEAAGFPKPVIREAKRKALLLENIDDIEENEDKRQKIVDSMTWFVNAPITTTCGPDLRSSLQTYFPVYDMNE